MYRRVCFKSNKKFALENGLNIDDLLIKIDTSLDYYKVPSEFLKYLDAVTPYFASQRRDYLLDLKEKIRAKKERKTIN